MVVGFVLGTQEATPLEFWVAVRPEHVLRLDDVVAVQTPRPDSGDTIHFYGVVDYVRTLYEGTQFDTDTFLAKEGILPVNISYVAHVQVTRIEPEEYLPPHPGDPVQLALGSKLHRALYFDVMEKRIPAGMLRNNNPAYLNFAFISGEKGAHVNISGISGVATKTSYALFLLHAIFNAETTVLDKQRAHTKALIFNVKSEDLFFLDKPNKKLQSQDQQNYQILAIPVTPFKDVRFCAVPRQAVEGIDAHLEQRAHNISVYLWSIRELCRDRLFSFLFAGEDLERSNLGFLVSSVEERLARLAENNDKAEQKMRIKLGVHLEVDVFGEGEHQVTSFTDLIRFLEDKLVENPDGGWLGRNTSSTAEALIRRLWGIRNEVNHLIRGDLSSEHFAQYQLDPLTAAYQLTVVDINKLGGLAQKFVVGVLLRKLFIEKEKRGQNPLVFVVLDELNKYAPREGHSPIKNLLVDIAERGRSLGIILIGAQQTASEVERRVVGQAAIRIVGRLDAAEAERPEYNFLTGTCRKRALLLKSGSLFIHQPEVPAPLLVTFPFPAYATRKSEMSLTDEEETRFKAKIKRL